ncbi:MAG: carboxypeptidase regulatory-like domain-containing protein [Polyangiaceae bacterium]|nr:carboxypeptidase regulatory-like domain-containing protein [Polyangiaceae bacterium]
MSAPFVLRRAAARLFAFIGIVLGLLAGSSVIVPREANAVPLRVRGASEVDLLASETESGVKLRGEVSDEMGASLGRVSVKLEALDPSGRPVRLEPPAPCTQTDPLGRVRHDGSAYVVTTDERGAFCVVAPGAFKGFTFRGTFSGNKLIEAADITVSPVPESEQRAQVSVRFESPPSALDLDKDSHTLTVSLRIARSDAQRLFIDATKKQGLELSLEDERGTVLGKVSTGGDGRARFEVRSADLAGPGDGELKVTFTGDKQLMPAKTNLQITRTASAQIEAPSSIEGDPDAGLPFDVKVTSSHGAVDGGIVEALLGNDAIGTGEVHDGVAKMTVSFAGGAQAKVPVTLRYVPSSPFFRAGPTATVEVAVKGPSPIRQILLAAVGLVLAGWIVAKWRRAPKRDTRESAMPPPPSGRPEILVLERPSGLRGWRGVVNDAHDGYPIAGAELRIIVPAFDGRGELARAVTDKEGTFAIDLDDVPKDARLVVEGELHATYEQPLPAPSVLRVALVTRRRALLDRLVRWARARGTPFDSSKEPTPGHVRRVAARTGAQAVEQWASQVEEVAFGAVHVTRNVEEALVAVEPNAHAQDRQLASFPDDAAPKQGGAGDSPRPVDL